MTDLIEPYPGAATDLRRSCAVMAHFLRSDLDGIGAVIRDATDDPRPDAEFFLLLAICDIAYSYSPMMQDARAQEFLSRIAARAAAYEAAK